MTAYLLPSDLQLLLQLLLEPGSNSNKNAAALNLNTSDREFPQWANSASQHQPVLVADMASSTETPAETFVVEGKFPGAKDGYYNTSFYYLNNPDSTVRWFYPTTLKSPTFLNTYNPSTLRGRLLANGIRLAFRLGLSSTIASGRVTVYHRDPLAIDSIVGEFEHYSIFTGTVGPNRKAVIEVGNGKKSTCYFKLPLTPPAGSLVRNEKETLTRLQSFSLPNLVVPEVVNTAHSVVGFTSVQPSNPSLQKHLTKAHYEAWRAYASQSLRNVALNSTTAHQITLGRLIELESNANPAGSVEMVRKLRALSDQIDLKLVVPTSLSHGDFTPWNSYVAEDKLFLFDWELSQEDAPVLFDLFHYVFQAGVLVQHSNFQQLKRKVQAMLDTPEVREMVQLFGIDPELQYRLFLLQHITHYLWVYSKQEEHHQQIAWLTEVWHEALDDKLALVATLPHRPQLIKGLFAFLQPHSYALLKHTGGPIETLSENSDLDILVAPASLQATISFLQHHPAVSNSRIVKQSFMTKLELFLVDGSFLQVDLLTQFKRKGLQMFSAKETLELAEINAQGLKVACSKCNFLYIYLFYQLNGSAIPQRYKDFFLGLPEMERQLIHQFMDRRYRQISLSLDHYFQNHAFASQFEHKLLLQSSANRGLSGLVNKLNYWIDILKRIRQQRGLTITFTGVDGVGKSTLINDLRSELEQRFRQKVVLLRHRPSLLPILSSYRYGKKAAEEKATNRLPRQGTNQNKLGSLLRFCYYFSDYLFGQFYVFLRYNLWGTTVIFDRYYFDFINDARRSNIAISPRLTRSLYALLREPNVNILLTAPVSVIYSRKQEVGPKEIHALNKGYIALFNELGKRTKRASYCRVTNINRHHSLTQIVNAVTSAA